ncbi:MAG: lipase [Alteromonadaceae bacterium]|nr:MAG: lipase [Alteromonadaceae bacterium]
MSNSLENQPKTISRLDGSICRWHDLRKSLLFAELSKIAYCGPEQALELIQEIGFTHSEFIEADGAQAYIFSNNTDCVLAFRGTEPQQWNDIRADIRAWPVIAETVGRVHRGFKQEIDDLWPMLENKLLSNKKELWLCGHSLGAAMATICSSRCAFSEINSETLELFTYGSPRVGTKKYVNHCSIAYKRWVNNNDIVARSPPTWLGYRHMGSEIYLNAYGKVRKMTALQRTKDRMRGLIMGLKKGSIDYFSDHSINAYIENIHQAYLESLETSTDINADAHADSDGKIA